MVIPLRALCIDLGERRRTVWQLAALLLHIAQSTRKNAALRELQINTTPLIVPEAEEKLLY